MRIIKYAVFAFFLSTTFSCRKEIEQPPIVESISIYKHWMLNYMEYLVSHSTKLYVPEPSDTLPITLYFSDGTAYTGHDCKVYKYKFVISNNLLKLDYYFQTDCTPDKSPIYATFISSLGDTKFFKLLDNDTLVLINNDYTSFIYFSPNKRDIKNEAKAISLSGVTWKMECIKKFTNLEYCREYPRLDLHPISFNLNANKTVEGTCDLNRYSGSVEINGDKIKINDIKKYLLSEDQWFEDYIGNLYKIDQFTSSIDTLLLYSKENYLRYNFVRSEKYILLDTLSYK